MLHPLPARRLLPVLATTLLAAALIACDRPATTPGAAPAPDGHNAANSLDWPGYYFGTLPCASCPGIETWLELNDFDGRIQYQLVENYLEEADGLILSIGAAQWDAGGKRFALTGADENRMLAVSEDHVVFVGENQDAASADPAYRLAKLESHAGDGQQLLVDPARIQTSSGAAGAKLLRFEAVINFEHAVDGSVGPGHKSLRAHYLLDCGSRSIEMPSVRYFSEHFASGKLLDEAENGAGEAQPLSAGDDPLWQFAQQHCASE